MWHPNPFLHLCLNVCSYVIALLFLCNIHFTVRASFQCAFIIYNVRACMLYAPKQNKFFIFIMCIMRTNTQPFVSYIARLSVNCHTVWYYYEIIIMCWLFHQLVYSVPIPSSAAFFNVFLFDLKGDFWLTSQSGCVQNVQTYNISYSYSFSVTPKPYIQLHSIKNILGRTSHFVLLFCVYANVSDCDMLYIYEILPLYNSCRN